MCGACTAGSDSDVTSRRPASVLEQADEVGASPTSPQPAEDGNVASAHVEAQLAQEPLRITSIERYGSEDTARVVIFLTRPAPYELGELPVLDGAGGPRLFLDIAHAQYQGEPAFDVGGVIKQVRVGQHDGFARIVLDLREQATKRVFFLPEPFRLIVDVATVTPRTRQKARKGGTLARVVLDPGHGGYDPGATGAMGLMEKDVALDVALRAAPLIARELGVSTLLTREGDEYVPLDERVAKANAFHADLFISIHCNASYTADSHGVMTFVLDTSGDRIAQQIAARENDASEAASNQLAKAMRQVMDTATVRASHRFARLLQRASVASLNPHYLGVADGGVRRAGFYVLAGAQMPAVLFEASFISNPTEELRLESADYRQRLADGIVNAIRAYQAGL